MVNPFTEVAEDVPTDARLVEQAIGGDRVALACEQRDGKFVVTSRLTGNFPGSPLNLRFFFGLEGGKIASLAIIP